MKRVLLVAAAVVAVLVAVPVGIMVAAFTGSAPLVDGAAVGPGVTTVKDSFVAAFVVDAGEGSVVLVDAGMDKEAKAILATLAARKLGPDAVKAIFITHGHGDHTAGLAMFPNAKVHVMAAELPLLDGTARAKSPMSKIAGVKPAPIPGAVTLVDGQVVEVGALKVEAFQLPGHTAGSAAYLINGALFLGDSADTASNGELRPAKWVFSDSVPTNKRSLQALAKRLDGRAADVKFLVPAHSAASATMAPLTTFALTAEP